MKFSQQFIDKVAASKFVADLKAGKVSMDNSEFSYWNGCFSAGLYYGALRRVPARGRSALAYGSAVHVGIENFLRGDPQWLGLACSFTFSKLTASRWWRLASAFP